MKRLWLLLSVMLLALPLKAQNDSPCNQGRAVEPLIDPRNEQAICLPELGRRGGHGIYAIGDIDHSGTNDWLVSISQYDLLLYRGIPQNIPDGGERISPTEPGSMTDFLAAGDWDGNGNIDLACRVQLLGDTSAGNTDGYDISQLVIFWNDGSGRYSIQDTTRLSCEAEAWLGIYPGVSADLDGDGITDLFIRNGSGLTQGQLLSMPRIHLFRGHKGQRWGRNGEARTADWKWWYLPLSNIDKMYAIDQNADGNIDISLHDNNTFAAGNVAVLYGRKGALPDTNDVEWLWLRDAVGYYSSFIDVTGDHIPELVTCGGQTARVYLGLKGQRLKEQYGKGIDSAPAGQPRWKSKPWAEVWQPNRINSNWFGDNGTLFDLGDGDLDGINDIWTASWPYLLMYRGGHWMDSLVDGLVRTDDGLASATLLGDIDATGVPTIALDMGNSILYFKPSRDIPKSGIYRELPEGTGPAAVEGARVRAGEGAMLELQAIPNSATREVQLQWSSEEISQEAVLTVHDLLGREIARWTVPAHQQQTSWNTKGMVGAYFITVEIDGVRTTTKVIVE